MADGDLERRLGEVLRDRAGGFTPSGDLPARIGARTRQRAHNRRVAMSAAAAVLVAVAAPLALRDRGDDQETATVAAESAPATTALSSAGARVSDSAGATSRAAEGGADTTAAASDSGAPDTVAAATEAAPGVPPAAASTTAPAGDVADAAAPPPYLLAVMPGDARVALVSTQSGQVVRYVEGRDGEGEVFYDQAGEFVYRAGGCGTTAEGVAVSGDDAIISDTTWRDATAITSWGNGPSQRFAWVTDNSCNGGSGSSLTVRTSAGDRTLPVPDVGSLAFSPDGTTLVWSESDGVAALDLTNTGEPTRRTPSPDPGCPVVAVSTIGGTPRVAVLTQCADASARLFTLDPMSEEAPVNQGSGASFTDVHAIAFDATAQWIVVTHSSGIDIVSASTSDAVATIPGAHSPHWTTATG